MPSLPTCYGTNLWSTTDPECIGGLDAGYINPLTGSHVRERCSYYGQCGQMRNNTVCKQSNYTQSIIQAPQVVQASPLQTQFLQKSQVLVTPVPPKPAPNYSTQATMPSMQAYNNQNMVPPWVAQMGPAQVAAPYQQPGSQLPLYLTVPEPVIVGESIMKRLFRELFRSVAKSVGYAIASFFDNNPLKMHQPPQ